jgi:hypothetical protein
MTHLGPFEFSRIYEVASTGELHRRGLFEGDHQLQRSRRPKTAERPPIGPMVIVL